MVVFLEKKAAVAVAEKKVAGAGAGAGKKAAGRSSCRKKGAGTTCRSRKYYCGLIKKLRLPFSSVAKKNVDQP